MNVLELSCLSGSDKLLRYFIDECNLRSPKDFQMTNKNGVVETM